MLANSRPFMIRIIPADAGSTAVADKDLPVK